MYAGGNFLPPANTFFTINIFPMKSRYDIAISIKTPEGMIKVGGFLIGNDAEFANTTFDSLKGNSEIDEHCLLRIDLVNKGGDYETFLKSISCSLDEYTENSKIITRDVFKYFTLENKNPSMLLVS